MDNKLRKRIYKKQGDGAELTERQKRRIATKRALQRGKAPRRQK